MVRDIVHSFVQNYIYMITTTVSDLRKNMKTYFDQVAEDDEVIIVRRKDSDGIVIMSLKEYNKFKKSEY